MRTLLTLAPSPHGILPPQTISRSSSWSAQPPVAFDQRQMIEKLKIKMKTNEDVLSLTRQFRLQPCQSVVVSHDASSRVPVRRSLARRWRATLWRYVVSHVDGGRHGDAEVVRMSNYCSRGSSMHASVWRMGVPVDLAGVEPAIIMARRVPTPAATCVRWWFISLDLK